MVAEVFAAGDTDYIAKLNSVSQKADSERTDKLINGALRIWQRGTSFTPAASTVTYTCDRFFAYRATSAAFTVSRVAGVGARYGLKAQRNAGDTATQTINIGYVLETDDTIGMAGKTMTLGFDVKAGANYSSGGNDFWVAVFYGTGTDQSSANFMANTWTGQTAMTSQGNAITVTNTRYYRSFTIPSNATQVGFYFAYTPTGTAGADDSFTIQNLSLTDSSSIGSPILRPIASDYTMCLRYCHVFSSPTAGVNVSFPHGGFFDANNIGFIISFPQMRSVPSLTLNGTANTDYGVLFQTSIQSGFTFAPENVSQFGARITGTKTAHGLTSAPNLAFGVIGNTPGRLIFSAEL